MKALLLALTTVAFTSALLSCSAHEFANPQRKSNADCKKAGGKPIGDKFCLLGGGGAGGMDAGHDMDDGGPDAGGMTNVDGGGDAGPPQPCDKDGETERCYDGDEATSLQMPCKPGMRTCNGGVWGDCMGEVTPTDEHCNGTDDDCDGKSDEDTNKNDACAVENQQGACAEGVQICKEGAPICAQVVFPTTDVCNGKDDDCDGNIDENTDIPCYEPDDGGCTKRTDGSYACVGTCKQGAQVCDDGQYGACTGSVVKGDEVCTKTGDSESDENCDGKSDENCDCHDGEACYSGPQSTLAHAPCKAGMKVCSDAKNGTCTNEVVPVTEDCSNEGKDDDCNGKIDDWAPRNSSCSEVSTAKGACKAGATWQCVAGKAACVPGTPGDEICDGLGGDEDCDGKADEDFQLDGDSNNCGSCGHKCTVSQTCCDGSCVDTRSSNANCSACGASCTSGQTCCNSSCINPSKDKNNCGSCGNTCTGLNSCANGACVLLGL
jgi:hypothetical protein